MKINDVHVTYCTNIHGGEQWDDHFKTLQTVVPKVKQAVAPNQAFGLGLRLSAQACAELLQQEQLMIFKSWLQEQNVYVFTMNGFPYGDFHLNRVKEQVHSPDWSTEERLDYTKNMFSVLSALLPDDLVEGGISTSPLSYRFWHDQDDQSWNTMLEKATLNIIKVAEYVHHIEMESGQILHLDIEPEPDGVLENGAEFIAWYENHLLRLAYPFFEEKYHYSKSKVQEIIHQHIRICYDVCHAAVEFDVHRKFIKQLQEQGIKIGKFQISSAVKIEFSDSLADRQEKKQAIQEFNEQIYLHQVVAKDVQGDLKKYPDINEALPYIMDLTTTEWRSHFHVPIFLENYGAVSSTQQDILEVLALHRLSPLTTHIEIETYTWNVLPKQMQVPVDESITREMKWLINVL